MRKVERELVEAIKNGKPFNAGNRVYNPTTGSVALWGNVIAEKGLDQSQPEWQFTLAGWNTPTTRSTLNALFTGLDLPIRVRTKKGVASVTTFNYYGLIFRERSIRDDEWFVA